MVAPPGDGGYWEGGGVGWRIVGGWRRTGRKEGVLVRGGSDSLQLTCLLNELNLPCRGQDIHLHFHHPTHALLSLVVAHAV